MSYLHGKFVWFEHVSNDIGKARKFYDALFGWNTEAVPMGGQRYFMIYNGEEGVGGYCLAEPEERHHWVGYLSVDDVDAAHAAAVAAGATSLMEPGAFGEVGRGSALVDPTGAVFALWKGSQGDRPEPSLARRGDWGWNELWTSDVDKALAFYTKVFGYTTRVMENSGHQGTYHVLLKDGVPRAGVSRSVRPNAPSMWLPYLVVDDCDEVASRAKLLGAHVIAGPTEIQGLGRYAVLIDPLGAAVSVIRLVQGG